jgi:hypothetical protein
MLDKTRFCARVGFFFEKSELTHPESSLSALIPWFASLSHPST